MSYSFYLVNNVSCRNPWEERVVISRNDFMSQIEKFSRFNVKVVDGESPEKVTLRWGDSSPQLDVYFSQESAEIQEMCCERKVASLSELKPLLLAVMCVLGYPLIDEYSVMIPEGLPNVA